MDQVYAVILKSTRDRPGIGISTQVYNCFKSQHSYVRVPGRSTYLRI